jgi:hypothetical protein
MTLYPPAVDDVGSGARLNLVNTDELIVDSGVKVILIDGTAVQSLGTAVSVAISGWVWGDIYEMRI